ncbi:hypothetical protein, partial [Rhodohalobacter halophilus]|uniref:hypothetical protein n=1 Tax=Rhodohalobacter halophilus TaxID=1812810 RepID=UPI001C402577
KLNSTGDWVSMLNSCLERNINSLSNIQIVEDTPSYIIQNSSAESGSNFVANYTIGSVVTPTSLGPLFYHS